jgi:hypothetical protein
MRKIIEIIQEYPLRPVHRDRHSGLDKLALTCPVLDTGYLIRGNPVFTTGFLLELTPP